MNSQNGRNAKGEDPAKFLREMQQLVPILEKRGIIGPQNREEARAQGAQSRMDLLTRSMEANQAEVTRRIQLLARWYMEKMAVIAPLTSKVMYATGFPWVFKLMGYRLEAKATTESVQGVPGIACTIATIKRFWWRVAAERLVWEEPIPLKPRIIKP